MGTLADGLLDARVRRQAGFEETLEVPGWSGRLWATYRPLEYRETRQIGLRHERVKDVVEKELRVAADTLVAACVRCEARHDGRTETLPPVGLALCQEIGLDGPENNTQAVLELFPSESAVMDQFVQVLELEQAANEQVDAAIEGNSEAAAG